MLKNTIMFAVVAGLILALAPAVQTHAGVVAHWKMDGDATDSSVNLYHATEQNGPGYATGQIGDAISLNGTSQYADAPDMSDAGDTLLAELGRYMAAGVRGSDIPCRYGGEEFMILLRNADAETAAERADQLRAGVEALEVRHDGQPLGQVTISCGVATFPVHAGAKDDLIRLADQALYAAKRNGRNQVRS